MTSIRSLLSLALVSSTFAANFNYPYASSIQSFSETLQPGACIGVFEGANTNFTCPCVQTESFSAFINCIPVTVDQVGAYCAIPTPNCEESLCPGGSCPNLELNGTYVPESTCDSSKSLGWAVVVGCGCYSASDRFIPCSRALGTTGPMMCTSENIVLDGTFSDGMSHVCTSQCSDGSSSCLSESSIVAAGVDAAEDDGTSLDYPDSDSAVAAATLTSTVFETRTISTSTVLEVALETTTVTSTSQVTPTLRASRCTTYRFELPPACCPNAYLSGLTSVTPSRQRARKMRHRRDGTTALTIEYATVDETAVETQTTTSTLTSTAQATFTARAAAPVACNVSSVNVAWGCSSASKSSNAIAKRLLKILAAKKASSSAPVIVDCGTAGQFQY